MTKAAVTINSRKYNVIAEENEEYIKKLADHINDKIDTVLKNGTNIIGERPIVLAALNICDEYFKVLEAGKIYSESMQSCTDKLVLLQDEYRRILGENEKISSENASFAGENKRLTEENNSLSQKVSSLTEENTRLIEEKKILEQKAEKNSAEDKKEQIEKLKAQVKNLEEKVQNIKKEYEIREQEILDMIDNS